jgi:hypothetical protein
MTTHLIAPNGARMAFRTPRLARQYASRHGLIGSEVWRDGIKLSTQIPFPCIFDAVECTFNQGPQTPSMHTVRPRGTF